MIEFNYQFDDKGVWIHKPFGMLDAKGWSETSTHYDNPKNAAEVCYLLLTGLNLILNHEECIEKKPHGDQDDLLKIAKTFSRNESDSLFASVFFEEVHLFFYINGLLGGNHE